MCLGLIEQSQRVAWADVELEVEVPLVDEVGYDEQRYQTSCSENGHRVVEASRCSRNNRMRRSRRKTQGDNIASMQRQKAAELAEPALLVSRPVERNVVTWNDLIGCSDTSPSVSQASTATSSPIPSPPLSARMPCYAGATAGTNPIPLMILPGALASSGNLGPLLGTSAPSAAGGQRAGTRSAAMNPAVARLSAPSGSQQAQLQGGVNGMMHFLYQDLPGLNASSSSGSKLEALLYQLAQTPYED